MRFRLPRQSFIPKGAVRVADKLSDAVAYLHTNAKGKPAAVLFSGKRDKPDGNFYYLTEAERERAVRRHFEGRRAMLKRKDELAEERKAAPIGLEVGDILNTSWGYEQTNVEFYEVVEVLGRFVVLREVRKTSEETGFDTGTCLPVPGAYKGEPIRRKAMNGSVKIEDHRYAHKWNTGRDAAGKPTGRPVRWSSYH